MGLFKKGKYFYGEFQVDNKTRRINLNVLIEGKVPAPFSSPGDAAFERSRGRALAAFEELKANLKNPIRAARLLEKVYDLSTGQKTRATPLSELHAVWEKAPRNKDAMTSQHKKEAKTLIDELISFAKSRNKQIDEARKVTFEIAAAFMRMRAEGRRPKTHDNLLRTLRAVFAAADDVDKVTGNPFKKIPLKKGDPISRIPFSEEELRSILSVAETDTVIGGMVIAAACSGMRRADCARLQWGDVDLAEGYIIRRSSKTNKIITIPILAPLRKALEKLTHNSGYCFPNAAEMFLTNPDGLNWRLAKLVQKAGVKLPAKPLLVDQQGKRAPSTIGFHRFKSTFVTMSLDAGIPIAIVQKIVGNTDVRVLLKHYHRPDKKTLSDQMECKLPTFLTGAKAEPTAIVRVTVLLEGMNAENWQLNRVAILQLLTESASLC